MESVGIRDFRLLLAGQTATQLGTQVSGVALPLLAVLTLAASPLQLGVLSAAGSAAVLVIGLPAGAWLDRVRRRPVLIASDLVRAVLLLTVPIAAALHVLGYAQLLVVVLLAGVARVLFDVGYQSYLPSVIGPDRVLRGNAALELLRSGGQVVGPGLGGALVSTAGAASAFLVDAASFAVSAVALLAVRHREAPPAPGAAAPTTGRITEGLRLVARDPRLRGLGFASALGNLQFAVASAVSILFLTRVLDLPAAAVGLLIGGGALGAAGGAALTPLIAARVGSARIVWLAPAAAAPFALLIVIARPGPLVAAAVVSTIGAEAAQLVYAITSVSLRQRICPPGVLGRVNATMRVVILGLFPFGALIGGVLGDAIGARTTLIVAGLLGLASPVAARLAVGRARDVEDLAALEQH